MDSPFTSSGTPTASASTTDGCATAADSTSAGPIRLPATLIVSSERPLMYQKPSASIRAQSPCTQVPGMRAQYASTYRSGSRQNPWVIPGHGWRMTSSPTSPRTGLPSASTTSAAMPGHGPANEHGAMGVIVVQPTIPPLISVPPE